MLLIFAAALIAGVAGRTFIVENKCPHTIWPGMISTKSPAYRNGGWELAPGASSTISTPAGFNGRIWARSGCAAQGSQFRCETGDCGGRKECAGAGGVPPVTLAEFTLDGHAGLDYYDVSNVDGYNLPMAIKVGGSHAAAKGYTCSEAGCYQDLNAFCPQPLQVVKGGRVVACMSACEKFREDRYCCHGAYNVPATCQPKTWPVNYAAVFKRACPKAYSYAYDDQSSTFTCSGRDPTYTIVFCPGGAAPQPQPPQPSGGADCRRLDNTDGLGPAAGQTGGGGQSFADCSRRCRANSRCGAFALGTDGNCYFKGNGSGTYHKNGVTFGVC